MASSVTFKSNWIGDQLSQLDKGVLEMANDVLTRAKIVAPVGEVNGGNLVNSGRLKRNSAANYSVVFGGSGGGFSVPYALRRNFENFKTPSSLGYLTKTADSVARGNIKKYFRDI